MNLTLPPERSLPHADRMLDQILADAPAVTPERAVRPNRGRVFLIGSVAAGLAITATAVGINVLRPGGGQLVGDPPSTSVAVPSPSASASGPTGIDPTGSPTHPTPTGRPTQSILPYPTVPIGTSQMINGLAVSVTDVDLSAADAVRVRAQICVVDPRSAGNPVDVGWTNWQLSTSSGQVGPVHDPSGSTDSLFPQQSALRGRACATGWLSFAGAGMQPVSDIRFTDATGNVLVWSLSDKAVPTGTMAKLPHLKVTMESSYGVWGVYVLNVKTCVTSLPAGSNALTLGWSNWTLATSTGPVDSNVPLHNVPPLPSTYPNGRYRVGECALGTVPLGSGANPTVYAINFTDSLGDHVVWRPVG